MTEAAADRSTAEQIAEPPKPDLLWPYFTRIIAISMVVVIHSVAGTIFNTTAGSDMWWGAVLLDASASWAVPVFSMMSGALLLAPRKWTGAGDFYRRRFVKIGVPALVWIGIYLAYRRWYLDSKFSVHDALAFTLSGYPGRHLYYVFVILGLYAITPLVRILIEKMTRQQLWGLTSVCIALSWFNTYIGNEFGVANAPNAVSFFLPHVGYFLAGYMLRDVVIRGWWLVLVISGVAATIVGEAVQAYHLEDLTPLSKFSALTIVMSLLMFVALVQLGRIATERGYNGRVLRVLAAASFGVYLAHLIVLEAFTRVTGISLYPATVVNLALTVISVIVLTWAVVLVIQRIPLLKRIV